MTRESLHSVFERVGRAKTKKEKIAILQENSGPLIKAVLGYTYNPRINWLLPEGTPPYKALTGDEDASVSLNSEMKRFYLFVEGPTNTQRNLTSSKRESLFIQSLEALSPDDCKILIGMKERKLPYRGLTRKLVAEAFPNLAKDWF